MKAKIFLSAAFSVFLAHLACADDIPREFEFPRYQPMMERCPFAVATPINALSPAQNIYVTGALHTPEGFFVTIRPNLDKSFTVHLSTKGPEKNYKIRGIEWWDKEAPKK